MGKTNVTAGAFLVIGFAVALLSSVGCGGDDGNSDPIPAPMSCSDGGAASANTVTMNCAGAIDGTTEQVDVVMGGPTSGTTTFRGLNFDVVYDPTKLEFVPATEYTSPIFDPSALLIVALANAQQGRLVVGIQQVDGVADVTVPSGQHSVLSLTFRRVAGANFEPTPIMFDRAEATAASTGVVFDSDLVMGYQE